MTLYRFLRPSDSTLRITASSKRLSSTRMLLVFSSNSLESPWRYPLRLWFRKKRSKSFKRVLEVISGPKRSMGIVWFFTASPR